MKTRHKLFFIGWFLTMFFVMSKWLDSIETGGIITMMLFFPITMDYIGGKDELV